MSVGFLFAIYKYPTDESATSLQNLDVLKSMWTKPTDVKYRIFNSLSTN